MKPKPIVWVIAAAALGFGLLMYTSFQGVTNHRVEVCMAYQGQQACQTASGQTEAEARRTALDTACAQISSGMTDSVACQNGEPVSVRVLTD